MSEPSTTPPVTGNSHQAIDSDQAAVERVDAATTLQRAQQAFWGVVSAAYPDAVSGDLPPETEDMLENAMATAIDTWVSFNVPDVTVGQIETGATFKNSETGEAGDIHLEGFVPALFEVADGPYAVPGYHKPSDRWNGWACPHFTKQGADFLVGKIGGMSYDAYRDIYVVGDPDFDEPETFGPVEIEVAGKKLKTYAIGAWSWVWVAYKNRSELPDSCEVPKFEV